MKTRLRERVRDLVADCEQSNCRTVICKFPDSGNCECYEQAGKIISEIASFLEEPTDAARHAGAVKFGELAVHRDEIDWDMVTDSNTPPPLDGLHHQQNSHRLPIRAPRRLQRQRPAERRLAGPAQSPRLSAAPWQRAEDEAESGER